MRNRGVRTPEESCVRAAKHPPLWRFPNVILTPHVSGADKSDRYLPRIAALFAENVARYQQGRPLLNELTREEWLEA